MERKFRHLHLHTLCVAVALHCDFRVLHPLIYCWPRTSPLIHSFSQNAWGSFNRTAGLIIPALNLLLHTPTYCHHVIHTQFCYWLRTDVLTKNILSSLNSLALTKNRQNRHRSYKRLWSKWGDSSHWTEWKQCSPFFLGYARVAQPLSPLCILGMN